MALLSRLFGGKDEDGWIDSSTLAADLKHAEQPLVVDVRGPDEFTGPLGHIDGARNLPLPDFPAHVSALLAENRPIVLVCHTDRRSSAAAAMLLQAGANDVKVLRGGMVGWRA